MKIKEMDFFNGSYHNSFYATYCMVRFETEQLIKRYPSPVIDDVKSYQSRILFKLVRTFFSLYKLINELRDYNSAGVIIRVLIDTLSSYYLIYHEKDNELVMLRHYLFVIDGLNERLKQMSDYDLEYDDHISQDDAEKLDIKVRNAQKNSLQSFLFCVNEIRKLTLYQKHKENIEHFIKNGNWNFSSLMKERGHYPWAELHKQLGKDGFWTDIAKYYSQPTHGLSLSNLIVDNNEEGIDEPYYSFGLELMRKIQEIIERDFGLSKAELLDGFLESEFFKKFLLCLSQDKREEFLAMLNPTNSNNE